MPDTSFADFIKEARERKKKETLAQEILGRGRKSNAAGSNQRNGNAPQKPSLLSRMSNSNGINKSRSSSAKPAPAANINGKWQHDLHDLNNPNGPPSKKLNRAASASQIDRNTRTFNKFRNVLQENLPAPASSGFSIKGVAAVGPFTVYASNFAPGTTAADIEAVMSPVVVKAEGEVLSCKLISSNPTVMVELLVDRLDAANKLVHMFNGQKVSCLPFYALTILTSQRPTAGFSTCTSRKQPPPFLVNDKPRPDTPHAVASRLMTWTLTWTAVLEMATLRIAVLGAAAFRTVASDSVKPLTESHQKVRAGDTKLTLARLSHNPIVLYIALPLHSPMTG